MRGTVLIGVALAVLSVGAASAQAMPVSEFLTKIDALEKKGPLALMSKDFGVLKAEIGNSSKAVRADQVAADKAGRKIDYCLPANASMTSDELVAYLNTIPAAQRGMPVGEAFRGFVTRKYPCKP
ncbi:MAG: hypothetical protein ABIP91_01510 [Sphingomicrobium sp.]